MTEYIDDIMLAEYEEMQTEVSDRKRIALELKAERQAYELLKREHERLKAYANRVENERDYYQQASSFQGP